MLPTEALFVFQSVQRDRPCFERRRKRTPDEPGVKLTTMNTYHKFSASKGSDSHVTTRQRVCALLTGIPSSDSHPQPAISLARAAPVESWRTFSEDRYLYFLCSEMSYRGSISLMLPSPGCVIRTYCSPYAARCVPDRKKSRCFSALGRRRRFRSRSFVKLHDTHIQGTVTTPCNVHG